MRVMCELKSEGGKGIKEETRPRKKSPASSLRATSYRRTQYPSTPLELTRNLFGTNIKHDAYSLRKDAIETERERDITAKETKMRVRKTKREREREIEKERAELSLPDGNWRARRMAVLICTRSLELKVPSGALINLGVCEERGPSEDG